MNTKVLIGACLLLAVVISVTESKATDEGPTSTDSTNTLTKEECISTFEKFYKNVIIPEKVQALVDRIKQANPKWAPETEMEEEDEDYYKEADLSTDCEQIWKALSTDDDKFEKCGDLLDDDVPNPPLQLIQATYVCYKVKSHLHIQECNSTLKEFLPRVPIPEKVKALVDRIKQENLGWTPETVIAQEKVEVYKGEDILSACDQISAVIRAEGGGKIAQCINFLETPFKSVPDLNEALGACSMAGYRFDYFEDYFSSDLEDFEEDD